MQLPVSDKEEKPIDLYVELSDLPQAERERRFAIVARVHYVEKSRGHLNVRGRRGREVLRLGLNTFLLSLMSAREIMRRESLRSYDQVKSPRLLRKAA